MTRVACCQLAPVLGDLEHNVELSTLAVREATAAGADVVVLPELATSGYMFSSTAEALPTAIPRDHPVFDRWREAAGTAVVVGGFCERDEDATRVFNSAVVLDGDGARTYYRKTHLWDAEKLLFAPGDAPPPVVDTTVGRVGLCICYDLEFCEVTRSLALGGADIIAAPVNWPWVDRPEGERPPEVLIAMAAARTNRVAIAVCDRSGTERGQAWTEGSTVIGPDGWIAASYGSTPLVIADVDLVSARDKKISAHNDLFTDRRPEMYGLG